MTIRVLCFVITLLISCTTSADSIYAKIKRLNAATEQYANAILEGAGLDISSHPCATTGAYVSWDKTTDHGKQMFSLALSGMLADKTLFFSYSDTQCGLWGSQVLVHRIDLLAD